MAGDFHDNAEMHQSSLDFKEKPMTKDDVQNIREDLHKLQWYIRQLEGAIQKVNYLENYLTDIKFKLDTLIMSSKTEVLK